MELVLSTSTPWDALWSTKDGQVIYKTSCPMRWFHNETVSIEKVIPPSSDVAKGANTKDEFGTLSKVKVKDTYDSEITFRGQQTKITAEIFRKGGKDTGHFGLRNQYCTGPDGREYEWIIHETKVQLVLCDEAKTPVIHYHRRHGKTPWKEGTPASLEIFPEGLGIVDYIVTLFVFLERRRCEEEDDHGPLASAAANQGLYADTS